MNGQPDKQQQQVEGFQKRMDGAKTGRVAAMRELYRCAVEEEEGRGEEEVALHIGYALQVIIRFAWRVWKVATAGARRPCHSSYIAPSKGPNWRGRGRGRARARARARDRDTSRELPLLVAFYHGPWQVVERFKGP